MENHVQLTDLSLEHTLKEDQNSAAKNTTYEPFPKVSMPLLHALGLVLHLYNLSFDLLAKKCNNILTIWLGK